MTKPKDKNTKELIGKIKAILDEHGVKYEERPFDSAGDVIVNLYHFIHQERQKARGEGRIEIIKQISGLMEGYNFDIEFMEKLDEVLFFSQVIEEEK